MLKKLLNVEWKSSGRLLLVVCLGVLCANILAGAFMAIGAFFPVVGSYGWFALLTGLLMFVSVMGIIAMLLICFFLNVRSFFRLLGEEGYLLLTLPVTADQHITAKLLFAMASTLATGLFFLADLNILFFSSGNGFFVPNPLEAGLPIFLYVVLFFLLGLAASYLFCYLCIALAGHWPQQRLLASVLLYFGLQLALQVVGIFVVFGFACGASLFSLSASLLINTDAFMYILATLFVLLFAAFDVILWMIVRSQMTTKLNLL